ncbi:MAG: SpoIID/LytB domain-containing protein [Flavobacteriales bacterium]|nr:SpoIID/LytB domain-containing protein [Flavobacteriales bacterium]
MRLTALLLSLLVSVCMLAQEKVLRIGILRERTFRSVLVMSAKGTCAVFADGERKGEIQVNDGLRIDMTGRTLTAKSLNLSFTAKERIELVPRMETSGLRLRLPETKMAERTYPGSISIASEGGTIKLTNAVPIEAYTAGVVQAEAGKEHRQEYYKLQSVSCRTYALSNVRKHAPEGFELCDAVHCQVYHGACKLDSIKLAVEATKGMVMVDADIKLIHALFHSNCGGETMNAEDLWSKREPYLRSTVDTFCQVGNHANWQRTLTRKEWLGYLERRFGVKPDNKAAQEAVLNYSPECRDIYLGNTFPLIPLKHVREDLKLKSTFFTVTTNGDEVVLNGRGFGHGVGLCQEGAMHMARQGRSYTEILRHYYTDVHLVDVNTLDFFRDEDKSMGIAGPKR